MLRTARLIGEDTEIEWRSARGTEFMRRRRRLAAASPLVAVYMAFAVTGCQGPLGDPISKVRGGAHGVERLAGGMIVGSTSRALLPGENGDGYPVAGTHFFHPDHLGSSTYVTDALGHKVAETVYAPYGEVFEPASTGVDVFRSKFSGKEWDAGAELYYFDARHYDAYVGRFIQADIMLLGSTGGLASDLNRYAYAGNNPVVYTDPSGRLVLTTILIAAAVGAIIGATVSVSVYAATNHDNLTVEGFLIAALVGAVAGGLGGAATPVAAAIGTASFAATAAGVAVVVGSNAAGGFAASVLEQGLTDGWDDIDFAEAGITAAIDGATAGLLAVPSGKVVSKFADEYDAGAARHYQEYMRQTLREPKLNTQLARSSVRDARAHAKWHIERNLKKAKAWHAFGDSLRFKATVAFARSWTKFGLKTIDGLDDYFE